MVSLSLNTNNSKSFEDVNKKNKIISIILVICITIALLAGLYIYTIILGSQEDISAINGINKELTDAILELNEDVSSLNSTNNKLSDTVLELNEDVSSLNSTNNKLSDTVLELNEDIFLLNITNTELAAKIDDLEEQQQSSLPEKYDFLLFSRYNMTLAATKYYVKSGLTGDEVFNTTKFSEALLYPFDHDGKIVTLRRGTYELDSDVIFDNKSNVILDGQESILNLNGHAISFVADHYENNSNNQIRNFIISNGTFSLEDSFRATVTDMTFKDCESAIEVLNTNTWTEYTKFDNVYGNNCQAGITFKTPTGNGTGSYESTIIDRCSFDLYGDNSVAIMVEKDAEVSNAKLSITRIWMYANNNQTYNQTQTGLHVEGKMTNTIISGVVLEGFGNGTIYGIYLGENSTGFSDEGITFLENFTARIKNPYGKWLPGLFRNETNLTFDNSMTNSTTINRDSFTIDSFGAIINITDLSASEEVTIQIILNFVDHTSTSITLPPFSENQTYELTAKNLYDLYPSQNTIWNIEFLAQTNLSNSETNVSIEVFGTAT